MHIHAANDTLHVDDVTRTNDLDLLNILHYLGAIPGLTRITCIKT